MIAWAGPSVIPPISHPVELTLYLNGPSFMLNPPSFGHKRYLKPLFFGPLYLDHLISNQADFWTTPIHALTFQYPHLAPLIDLPGGPHSDLFHVTLVIRALFIILTCIYSLALALEIC